MLTLCWIFLVIIIPGVLSEETLQESNELGETESPGIVRWIEDRAISFLDSLLPESGSSEARKKKMKHNKYILPVVVGFLLIKSILLPIALKSLAVLSGKAVVLSLMSLILAAIVGLKKVAQGSHGSNYEVVNVPLSKYRRNDDFYRRNDDPYRRAEDEDDSPYQFYRDRK